MNTPSVLLDTGTAALLALMAAMGELNREIMSQKAELTASVPELKERV